MRRFAAAVVLGYVAASARRWWVATRPVPAPWEGWPDRMDLFPQRPSR